MGEKSTMLKEFTVCRSVLYNMYRHRKYLISRNIDTKEESLTKFRHEAYIILLIAEKMCDTEYLDEYRRLYNQLKEELRNLPGEENE